MICTWLNPVAAKVAACMRVIMGRAAHVIH